MCWSASSAKIAFFYNCFSLKFNLSYPKYYLVSNIWRLNVPNISSSKDRIFSSAISQNPFELSPQRRPEARLVTSGLIVCPRILWLSESAQYANRSYRLPKLRVNMQCQRSVLITKPRNLRFWPMQPMYSKVLRTWPFNVVDMQRTATQYKKNLKRMCTAIALLIKYSILCRTRCRCHRGLLKVPFISTWRRTSSLGCYLPQFALHSLCTLW